jgi:DinB superfamily
MRCIRRIGPSPARIYAPAVATEDRCDECGFVYDLGRAPDAGEDIRAATAELAAVLRNEEVDIGTRREPEVWSPLEYGCHMRDVLLVQRERVLDARRNDSPSCRPMGRDERVDHDGYTGQDPEAVARQLDDAAAMFANVLDRLGPDWDRTVVYNYPVRSERTLRWVAVHTVHESQHHLLDVRRQLR